MFSSEGFDEFLKKTKSSRKAQKTFAAKHGVKSSLKLNQLNLSKEHNTKDTLDIVGTTNWSSRRTKINFENNRRGKE